MTGIAIYGASFKMGRKRKEPVEVKELEYIGIGEDEDKAVNYNQILEYLLHEIHRQLEHQEYPLYVRAEGSNNKEMKLDAYYAVISPPVKEDAGIRQKIKVTYAGRQYVSGLIGGAHNIDALITDYDCVNLSRLASETSPNETWVEYVNGIVKDKNYMAKAQKYMHETYPEFFEKREKGEKLYRDYHSYDTSDKTHLWI